MNGALGGAVEGVGVDVEDDRVELAVAFDVEFERVGGGGGEAEELGLAGEIVAGDLVDAVADAEAGARCARRARAAAD